MKAFVRWPHIDNVENLNTSEILDKYSHCKFAITEKLDGCNVCISIPKNGPIEVFSRNGERWTDNDGVKTAMRKVSPFVRFARDLLAEVHSNIECVYLYGELVNWKIPNRIRYYEGLPDIVFFGLKFITEGSSVIKSETFVTLKSFYREFLCAHPLFSSIVHIAPDVYDGKLRLKDIDFDRLMKHSTCSTTGTIEGYVFHNIEPDTIDEFPAFKLKFPEFSEIKASKKPISSEVKNGREIFKSYITKNRVISLLSKIGIPDNASITEAVKALVEDAKEDFLKDHPEFSEHEDLKKILNAGSAPFLLIKQEIEARKS